MLVSGLTQRVDIPHEPGEWIEVRQLTAVDLDAAEAAAVVGYSRQARAMGPDLMASLQAANASSSEPVRPAVRYDAMTLLELGLAGWSYDAPLTPENLRRLDQRTRDWARDQVLVFNFPEADSKNASSGSTNGLTVMPSAGDRILVGSSGD